MKLKFLDRFIQAIALLNEAENPSGQVRFLNEQAVDAYSERPLSLTYKEKLEDNNEGC
jgi:hypothetical protein